MAIPSGNDGISVPITLDISEAMKQFDELKKIAQKGVQGVVKPTTNTPNYLTGGGGGGDGPKYPSFDRPLSKPPARGPNAYQMDMGAFARSGQYKMPTWALAASSARPAAGGGTKFEPPTPPTAQKIAEFREKNRPRTMAEKGLVQLGKAANVAGTGLKKVGQAATEYFETRGGENAKRYGRYAGLGVAGTIASGFSGTQEGDRLASEFKALSHEAAGSFKPLIEQVTHLTRNIRQHLQQQDTTGQNRIQAAGVTAGAAWGLNKLTGVGGLKSIPMAAMALAETAVTKANYDLLSDMYGEAMIRTGRRQREVTHGEMDRFGYGKMKGSAAEIDAELSRLDEARKEAMKGLPGTMSTIYNTLGSALGGIFGDENATIARHKELDTEFRKRKEALNRLKAEAEGGPAAEFQGEKAAGSNPDRRQVTLTEGVGFYSGGSTWEAAQIESIKTDLQEAQKQTLILERVAEGIEKMTK